MAFTDVIVSNWLFARSSWPSADNLWSNWLCKEAVVQRELDFVDAVCLPCWTLARFLNIKSPAMLFNP
jgi:hypothetical protein